MADGIYVALSGALAQSTNLDATATNLANASTDGYQRVRPIFREELARAANADPNSRYTALSATRLDTSRGPLRATGNPLDFAMPEKTYLAVGTPRGERYTRAGSLAAGADGTLRNTHGDAVLGEDGNPIKVGLGAGALRVDESGQVWQGQGALGRVKLVTFPQPENLTHDQGPLLLAPPAAGNPAQAQGPLEIGQVEESNANVVGAMTDLVSASRTFEAFQRVIDAFRDADRKVVTTVPDVT